MVAILRFNVPISESALGRALQSHAGTSVELESLVPSGTASVPFFWVYARDPDAVADSLREVSSIRAASVVETVGDATLLALEWDVDGDRLFRAITDCDGSILRAVCQDDRWEITIRFPEHEQLSAFKRSCEDAGLSPVVDQIYHHTDHAADPRFGLTDHQRAALTLAVERGYYDIPRRCTTADLAEELGISAQAVTERLRRAIANITEHTLLSSRSSVKL
ncbi:helix-turn-helix domain-containing protein [Natrononativus amylolyticus]|uniref:helix-turn-helix domain-containing protein n=1 Tax=Natrononativus amylolyticus TaxID=2963434 RepID=UPI0020CEC1FA|nr:helix-turn-helix domain-containing protein [Natrononativus amylolyticus]